MGSLTLTIMNDELRITNDELSLELRVESGFANAHNYELRMRNDELLLELRVEN